MTWVIPGFCGKNLFIMTKEFEIKLSPEEIAQFFNNLDSDEQAIFFDELHKLSKNKYDFPGQMRYCALSTLATPGGLQIMRDIGSSVE